MSTLKTVPAVIDAVVRIVSEPSRWTSDAEARNAAGKPVEPTDPDAASWSISGAISLVVDPDAEGTDDQDHFRRLDLEVATYHALGISTELDDGSIRRHDVALLILRHAQSRLADRLAA